MQRIGSLVQTSFEELARRAETLGADPERIAAYERSLRDATMVEARERLRRADASLRRLVPLRPEVHDAIARHCDPDLRGESPLRRTSAITAVAKWMADRRRTVLALLGTVGTGKTSACGLVVMRALLERQRVVYVKEPALLRWRKFIRHEKDFARAQDADVLIVDELGTCEARDHDAARMAVLELVDDRLGRGRTILAGNLDRRAFAARYDARLIDRLDEVGLIVDVSGPSMRGGRTAS